MILNGITLKEKPTIGTCNNLDDSQWNNVECKSQSPKDYILYDFIYTYIYLYIYTSLKSQNYWDGKPINDDQGLVMGLMEAEGRWM